MLQSTGSQRVGHSLATEQQLNHKDPSTYQVLWNLGILESFLALPEIVSIPVNFWPLFKAHFYLTLSSSSSLIWSPSSTTLQSPHLSSADVATAQDSTSLTAPQHCFLYLTHSHGDTYPSASQLPSEWLTFLWFCSLSVWLGFAVSR